MTCVTRRPFAGTGRPYARTMPERTEEMSRVLELVGDAVRGGHCILFLGAGVHAPPPDGSPFRYPAEQRPRPATR